MMKFVILGSGTPNAEPWASGPANAVIIHDKVFLVDCGPGIVRQCTKAFYQGTDELRPQNLQTVLITHMHSDHTAGLPDLILTPWVLERQKPLHVYGPSGIARMCSHIMNAWYIDTDFRNDGPEPINHTGLKTITHEIKEGLIYDQNDIQIYAYAVSHGTLESYCYKFVYHQHSIVISGDTCALEKMKTIARDADLLVHEAEYTEGLKERTPAWQNYHRKVHTMSTDLADIINGANVKKTITTHRILHLNYYGDSPISEDEIRRREDLLLEEITSRTEHEVVNGHDLDVFVIEQSE